MVFVVLGVWGASVAFSQRPPMQGDPGWFLEDWKPKKAKLPRLVDDVDPPKGIADVHATVDFNLPLTKISKYIFANNLGIWVNRANVDKEEFLLPLRDMGLSIIRYPGGNASNDFFSWTRALSG